MAGVTATFTTFSCFCVFFCCREREFLSSGNPSLSFLLWLCLSHSILSCISAHCHGLYENNCNHHFTEAATNLQLVSPWQKVPSLLLYLSNFPFFWSALFSSTSFVLSFSGLNIPPFPSFLFCASKISPTYLHLSSCGFSSSSSTFHLAINIPSLNFTLTLPHLFLPSSPPLPPVVFTAPRSSGLLWFSSPASKNVLRVSAT